MEFFDMSPVWIDGKGWETMGQHSAKHGKRWEYILQAWKTMGEHSASMKNHRLTMGQV